MMFIMAVLCVCMYVNVAGVDFQTTIGLELP